ncbi:MAG TPA: DUF4878 domain-containing protein [Niabella sp.]|nr:DUF4878 domain-containing protein [Niabella sp.]HQW14084.1 DUF4878 domain-containing protein [Niabella sp.]HQX19373.1 DUF4878 domain-containing protein [Niabella sp.]HQX40274.1 DUF4878 domain-containing protein [Niabella sp.]HRB05590.1 DUF4878 domain-containing protein [Niabella sp.]
MISCNLGSNSDAAENDLDAARNFIQSALKGRFDRAADYMLHDSVNDEKLDAVSRMQLSSAEKQGLWDASINIYNRKLLNDSTSIIVYSNSFHKYNKDSLKVVKVDGKWLVDFKYLFDHD